MIEYTINEVEKTTKAGKTLFYLQASYKHPTSKSWKTLHIPKEHSVTKAHAHIYVRDHLAKLEQTGVAPDKEEVGANKTIASLAEHWLKFRKEHVKFSPITYRTRKSYLNNWIVPSKLGRIDLETEFSKIKAQEFISYLRSQKDANGEPKLSDNTVLGIVQTASMFIKDAENQGWIKIDRNWFREESVTEALPQQATVIAKETAGDDSVIHLEFEQAIQLITCQDICLRRRTAYFFTIATGIRSNELLGMAWNQLELESTDDHVPQIFISRQLIAGSWKGEPKFKLPKGRNGGKTRRVPLHPVVIQWLMRWKEVYQQETGFAWSPDMPVFPGVRTPWSMYELNEYIREDLEKAGLPSKYAGKYNFKFHALRATFASLLEVSGVEPHRADQLLGHGRKSTRTKFYVAQNVALLAQDVERLDFSGLALKTRLAVPEDMPPMMPVDRLPEELPEEVKQQPAKKLLA